MAGAGRGSKGNALAHYSDRIEEDDSARVYRFQVLLPNGVSTNFTLHDPGEEISVSSLLGRVERELSNAPVGADTYRKIHWNGNICLMDLLDKKITDKIKLSNFDTKSINILRLHVSPKHFLCHNNVFCFGS